MNARTNVRAGSAPVPGAAATDSRPPSLVHLVVSPAHAYFGHHGGPAGTSPACEVPELDCVAGRGVRGDRFFDYRPDYKGQITLFALEVFERVCAELQLQGVPPTAVRRNVFTRGIDLNGLIGREFRLQGIRFLGTEECRPCYWMEQAVSPGTEVRLRGCGGLRAKIITSGVLCVGPARLEIPPAPR